MYPQELRYYKEHEWVRVEGDTAVIGITHFAQDQLGDVVYVDLPRVGTRVDHFAKFGEVESVKAVSDLFLPVAGEVTAVNEKLAASPELVNQDPYGEGWMLRVRMSDPAQVNDLMNAGQYQAMLAEAH